MAVAADDSITFMDYAHPGRLACADWLGRRLEEGVVGNRDLVVLESDEDVLLYDTGHIEGALKVDWHTDLNDPVTRDYVNGERFAQVLGEQGIGRDTTVVIYGDKRNWWDTYALWVFTLFGHEDVRLLDGGRATWVAEGREMTGDVPAPTAVDHHLLGFDKVRNDDGSWTEWGNAVWVPNEVGAT